MKITRQWIYSGSKTKPMNPVQGRELLVECFFQTQKETFARTKQSLGTDVTDESIRNSVIAMLRMAFKEVGGDYEQPTRETLLKVVEVLALKSKAWGTPAEVVNQHKTQMTDILRAVRNV